jgi:hypothetical protein
MSGLWNGSGCSTALVRPLREAYLKAYAEKGEQPREIMVSKDEYAALLEHARRNNARLGIELSEPLRLTFRGVLLVERK